MKIFITKICGDHLVSGFITTHISSFVKITTKWVQNYPQKSTKNDNQYLYNYLLCNYECFLGNNMCSKCVDSKYAMICACQSISEWGVIRWVSGVFWTKKTHMLVSNPIFYLSILLLITDPDMKLVLFVIPFVNNSLWS